MSTVALSILPAQSLPELDPEANSNKKVEDFKALAVAYRNYEEKVQAWLALTSRLIQEKQNIEELKSQGEINRDEYVNH